MCLNASSPGEEVTASSRRAAAVAAENQRKGNSVSVSRNTLGALVATVLVVALAAIAAGTAQAAPSTQQQYASIDSSMGTLDVGFAVKKFVARGKQIYAVGDVIGTFQSADGTTEVTRKPFTTKVRKISRTSSRTLQRATRICDILRLDLAPLRLELLGLIVELDRVVLTIKANSEGGLLGGLLCGLAGGSGLTSLPTTVAAKRLTTAAQQGGLAAGPGFAVPVQAPTALPPVPGGICTVLDLVLGPLDLNLLGLMIHLDRVQLRITADPTRGLLGSLLCALAGGPRPVSIPGG